MNNDKAASMIANALCDVRVEPLGTARLLTILRKVEQDSIFDFIKAYVTAYAELADHETYVNDNIQIATWARNVRDLF